MNVALCEQETIINIARDGSGAHVWTSDSMMITKFDKLCAASPDNYHLEKIGTFEDGSIANKLYSISDKGLLTFRLARKKIELTEEKRAALAERARNNLNNRG
jgi:hypothetical protein